VSKHTSDPDPTFLSQSYGCYRAAFEHLLSDSAIQDCAGIGVESKDIRRFQEIYRASGYLCSFPGCRRGFLGFPSASDRNNHESFHSPQFRCIELDCDFSKIGFNSRQALRKHTLKYHTSVNEVPLPRFGHRQQIAKRMNDDDVVEISDPVGAQQTHPEPNAAVTNGSNSASQNDSAADSSHAEPAASNNQPTTSNASQPAASGGAQPPVPADNIFTPEQLQKLRTQVYAFKMLCKNMKLPANMQKQLFPS
jgi:QLQ